MKLDVKIADKISKAGNPYKVIQIELAPGVCFESYLKDNDLKLFKLACPEIFSGI